MPLTPEVVLLAGNLSNCQSTEALQQIVNELRRGERLHKNVVVDLCVTAEITEKLDKTHHILPGYVRHISVKPFFIFMHMEESLRCVLEKPHRITLHLAATGSVVKITKSAINV